MTTPAKADEQDSPSTGRDPLPSVRLPKQDPCCEGPCHPPWRGDEQCLIWYETRYLRVAIGESRPADVAAVAARDYIEFRIVYEHRLCRLGKQLGPLLYTVTLLPGEKVTLYHSDRYARITSAQDRFSVETTFSQFLSQVHQAHVTSELDALGDKLSNVASGSVAGSVGLGGLLDLSAKGKTSSSSTADHHSVDLKVVSDQFNQSVIQASRLTHAERSVVISTYAEADVENVASRTLENANACRAVTYFVRKVMELFAISTIVADISYRIVAPNIASEWRPVSDTGWLPAAIQAQIKAILNLLPKVGDAIERPKPISLPTDGTVYDPELAHCSSCEPARAAAIEIELKRKQAETLKLHVEAQLLETEIERRRQLLQKGKLGPFESVGSEACEASG